MHSSITFVCTQFFLPSSLLLLFFISVSTRYLVRLLVDYKSCVYDVAIRTHTHTNERLTCTCVRRVWGKEATAQRLVTILLLYIMWLSSSQQQWQWRHQNHSHMKSTMKYNILYMRHQMMYYSANGWCACLCTVCACVHRQMCDAWLPANVKICIPFCRLFYFLLFLFATPDHAIDAIVLWTAHEFI